MPFLDVSSIIQEETIEVFQGNRNYDQTREFIINWCNKNSFHLTIIEDIPMNETGVDRYSQFLPLNKVFKDLNCVFNFYKIDKND